MMACRRLASVMSSRSPASWPRLSLTFLNRSRSTKSTATDRPLRTTRERAMAVRSRNTTRFGSPVSGSCVAWCTSRDCTATPSMAMWARSAEALQQPAVRRIGRPRMVEVQDREAEAATAVGPLDGCGPHGPDVVAVPQPAPVGIAGQVGDDEGVAFPERRGGLGVRVGEGGEEAVEQRTRQRAADRGGRRPARADEHDRVVRAPGLGLHRPGQRPDRVLQRAVPCDGAQHLGLTGHQRGRPLPLGDVPTVQHHARDRRVVEEVGGDRLEVPPRTVRGPHPPFQRVDRSRTVEEPSEPEPGAGHVVRVHRLERRTADRDPEAVRGGRVTATAPSRSPRHRRRAP